MVFATVLVTATLLRNSSANNSAPPTQELAGYALLSDRTHEPTVVHDPKSGFFLLRQSECDGGLLTLELTRDHHDLPPDLAEFASWEGQGHIKFPIEKPLPSLKTSKGVSIGDTPAKLTQLLGKPKKIEPSGERAQYTDYVYKRRGGRGERDAEYTETYTFKHGLLIQILFFRDALAFAE